MKSRTVNRITHLTLKGVWLHDIMESDLYCCYSVPPCDPLYCWRHRLSIHRCCYPLLFVFEGGESMLSLPFFVWKLPFRLRKELLVNLRCLLDLVEFVERRRPEKERGRCLSQHCITQIERSQGGCRRRPRPGGWERLWDQRSSARAGAALRRSDGGG